MTREPDRFEAKARELDRWIVRHYGVPESYTSVNEITAALRQAESDALKRVADNLRGAANGWRIYEHATAEQAFEVAIRELLTEARALASPAAAPAAEVCGAGVSDRWPRYEGFTCELPKGHGGFHLQGDTTWSDANTPSEPVAPAPEKSHAPYCCAGAAEGGPDHSTDCPHFAPVARAQDLRGLLEEAREMVDVLGEGHAADLVARIDAALADGGEGKT